MDPMAVAYAYGVPVLVRQLLFIREGLIDGDYCAALMQLMKFPPMEGNVHVLLERATELRVTNYRPAAP